MTVKQKAKVFFGAFTGTGFFACVIMLFLVEIPQGNKEVLITLMGALGGSFVTIMTYYFGDSDGHD